SSSFSRASIRDRSCNPSAACYARQQVYLALGPELLITRLRVDFAVDGDRHLGQRVGHARKARRQRGEQIVDAQRVDLDRLRAIRKLAQAAREKHSSHRPSAIGCQLAATAFPAET